MNFEMLVFGDGRGLPLILFPTSFGRYSQNKDFGLIDAVAGIQHWFDDRKWCGHDWNYWRDMLPRYLSKL